MEAATARTPSGGSDIFRHENESVDMFLQELKHDGPAQMSPNGDGSSPEGSPVKPLKCLVHKDAAGNELRLDLRLDLLKKDFNSSSDTYVSDHNEVEAPHSDPCADEVPGMCPHGQDELLQEDSLSPSKSIMKSSSVSSGSPKKSVAFQPSLDTLHTYSPKEPETTPAEKPTELSNHMWLEIDHSATSQDCTASPPAPPPHTSSTITGLLTPNKDFLSSDDEANVKTLHHANPLHEPENGYTGNALNDQLNAFWSPSLQHTNDDLDIHLDQLERAKPEETDVNIHRLSYHLEEYTPGPQENPLGALLNSLKLYINSAHSSQSSLQSLVDSNRQLLADAVQRGSKGMQFNDGIKGFPDTVAALLIALADANEDTISESSSMGSQFPLLQAEPQLRQSPDHSYDHSYNLTEKSILNLLNSAPHADMPGAHEIEGTLADEPQSLEMEEQNPSESKIAPQATPPVINTTRAIYNESPTIRLKQEIEATSEPNQEPENMGGYLDIKKEEHSFVCEHDLGKGSSPGILSENNKPIKSEPIDPEWSSCTPAQTASIKEEAQEEQEEQKDREIDYLEDQENHVEPPLNSCIPEGTRDLSSQIVEQLEEPESEGDLQVSGDEHSFIEEVPENFAETHTFQVDEKAVVPGLVKLVPSVETSAQFPAPPQSYHALDNQDATDVRDRNSSEDGSEAMHQTKLITEHHKASSPSYSTDSAELDEYKDSVEYSFQSLAPLRSENTTSRPKTTQLPTSSSDVKDGKEENTLLPQDFDCSVLANSSNITPPLNIKLPVDESDDDAFADLTQRLKDKSKSFEESLSAEHDVEKQAANFLSIWHSQLLGRRVLKPTASFYKAPSILTYNTADITQRAKYQIPPSLQPKKFTDVNLVSTRVLSLNLEDLNVSAFLPEISQDSGLEEHFRSLMRDQTTVENEAAAGDPNGAKATRRKSLESLCLLSELDRKNNRENSMTETAFPRRNSINETLRPRLVLRSQLRNKNGINMRQSRFHVPSFEIKRSNSILSPKNQYNDIFLDGSVVAPTIKAQGMKTLPSLDRDDVKKIMQMKQAMTLEEYSGLKNVGAAIAATQHKPNDKYEALQQRASIYCDSLASSSAGAAIKFRVPTRSAEDRPVNHSLQPHTKTLIRHNQINSLLDPQSHAYITDIMDQDKSGEVAHADVVDTSQSSLGNKSDTEDHSLPDPDVNFVSIENSPQKQKSKSLSFLAQEPLQGAQEDVTFNPFLVNGEQDVRANNSLEKSCEVDSAAFITKEPKAKVFVKSWTEISPEKSAELSSLAHPAKSARSSPIKIHSPIKVVKQNGSVTGIVLNKRMDTSKDLQNLQNKKLRTDKTRLSAASASSNVTGEKLSPDRTQGQPSLAPTQCTEKLSPNILEANKPDELGKLFFRVMSLKNVNVGDIRDRNVSFNMTLDNGIHCIKTPDCRLDSSKVAIDREFELSVSDSLEFILTLKATYSKPKPTYKEVQERKVVKSRTKLGRLFGSKEIVTTTRFVPQISVDPLASVFATDGSFARCYVDLNLYKNQITGQVCTFNLICYNEWASYSHNEEKFVKKPYPVAQLEVKMLYVPRNEKYEILPTSIKSAYESLHDLKDERHLTLEGYLHQEGGDCESWKRRWFKLQGTSLIAHSEFSHKSRAKINLEKVAEVIFVDQDNIRQSSPNYRNFSDIMLMGNSFKIRFANGETIDFGAPSRTEKTVWVKTIQEIVYRNKFRRQPWVRLMQSKNGDRRKLWVEA